MVMIRRRMHSLPSSSSLSSNQRLASRLLSR
ncbi:Uncharacterised protein [Vibrio cholerae]|nr:Uncharacterised protein [Vibrio cholerae]